MRFALALSVSLLCQLFGISNGFEYPHAKGQPVFTDKDDLKIANWIDEWTQTKDVQAIRDKLDLPPIVVITGGAYTRMRATVDIDKTDKGSSCTSKVMENWTKQKYLGKAMATKLSDKIYDLQLLYMPSISQRQTLAKEEIIDMYKCVAYCLKANIDENGKATDANGVVSTVTTGINKEGVITDHVKKTYGLFGYLNLPVVAFPLNRLPDDASVIGEFEKFLEAAYNDKSNTKKRKVVVLTYCSGGVYALRFLQKIRDTLRNKIQAWFTMGAPFGGDVKLIERVLSGGSTTVQAQQLINADQAYLLPEIFPVFQRMSFTGFLSPKKEAFAEAIVTLPGGEKYNADQLDELYEHAKIDANVRKHLKLAIEQNNIREATKKDLLQGIPVYCIYGEADHDTMSSFTYPFEPNGMYNEQSPSRTPGMVKRGVLQVTPGDSTATKKSAELCKTLIKDSDPKKFLVVKNMGNSESRHDEFIEASNAKQIGVYILSAIRKMKW